MPSTTAALPRILVFSENCISTTHGTGAIFLRNFSQYPPERLCNAFIGTGQDPGIRASIDLNGVRWPATPGERVAALPARLWNLLARRRPRALPPGRHGIARALQAVPFKPDLLYAICYGAEGFAVLEAVLAALPSNLPVLLHVHDFWPSTSANLQPLLKRLGPRLTAVWAVSRPIARHLTVVTGHPCLVDPGFHVTLPALHKTAHRAAGPDFQAVLLGNIWNPALLPDLKAAWRWCQTRRPDLPPIRWHCHPDGIAKLRAAGLEPGPELQPMEFLRGDALWRMLAAADLALIPFTRQPEPSDDYERYSMPSRVTELAAAGLPIFALTGAQTSLAEYLDEKGIGRHAPAARTETVGPALLALIEDREQREALGRRARAVAETEFSLAEFQQSLHTRLAELAFGPRAAASA